MLPAPVPVPWLVVMPNPPRHRDQPSPRGLVNSTCSFSRKSQNWAENLRKEGKKNECVNAELLDWAGMRKEEMQKGVHYFFPSGWGCLRVKLELHPARAFTCTDVAFNQGDVNTAAAFLERAVWEM